MARGRGGAGSLLTWRAFAVGLSHRGLGVSLIVVIELAVLGLLLLPSKDVQVVRDALHWEVSGQWFHNARPSPGDALPGMSTLPDTMFFRSWSPETLSTPGRIASSPFSLPSFLVVPLVGYPARPGVEVFLECTSGGTRLALASGNAHEDWSMRVIRTDPRWCPDKVRVIATNTGTGGYVGIGPPMRADFSLWMKQSLVGILALHALCFALFAAVVNGIALLARQGRSLRGIEFEVAVATLVLCAYAAFFAFLRSQTLGLTVTIATGTLALMGYVFAITPRQGHADRAVGPALAVLYCMSLLVCLVLYGADSGAARWHAAYRFSPAAWSSDHLLPTVVAEGIYATTPVQAILGGGWHVSDRPPLLAGIQLLLTPLFTVLFQAEASRFLSFDAHQITAIIATCVVAIGLLRLGFTLAPRALGWPQSVMALAVIVSPFFLFNAAYPWPKLLAAALALLATSIILIACRLDPKRSLASVVHTLVAGVLLGGSLLAHAGVAIGLPFIPILAGRGTRWRALRRLCSVAGVAVLLSVPWMLFQQLVDPPGNALTKFALAGTFGFESPTKSVTATVLDAYSSSSPSKWLAARWTGVLTMLGFHVPDSMIVSTEAIGSVTGALRFQDFVAPIPNLRLLLVPIICVALLSALHGWATSGAIQAAARTALVGSCGLAATLVLYWSTHILHMQSYFSLACLHLAAFLGLLVLPTPLGLSIATAQLAYVSWVWLLEPLAWNVRHEPIALVMVAVSAAACAAAIRAMSTAMHADALEDSQAG